MAQVRLSYRYVFILPLVSLYLFISHRYESSRYEFIPVVVPDRGSHSSTKTDISIMLARCDCSFHSPFYFTILSQNKTHIVNEISLCRRSIKIRRLTGMIVDPIVIT